MGRRERSPRSRSRSRSRERDRRREREYRDRDRERDRDRDRDREHRDRGRDRGRDERLETAPPELGSIHEGRVVGVKPFGAFVELDGYRTHGLVHISQLAPQRVEATEDVVAPAQRVRVKVLSFDAGKLSLSMRQVDQSTGADLGDNRPAPRGRRDEPVDTSNMTWGLQPLEHEEEEAPKAPTAPKVEPNFATTGKLAEETNRVNGVVLKWSEPADARRPSKHWRLYVFKARRSRQWPRG